ncbi:MAG: AMP-binding protein [Candidatus Dormiibacterota bacterium]
MYPELFAPSTVPDFGSLEAIDPLALVSAADPAGLAIVDAARADALTWAELLDRTAPIVAALAAAGVSRGSRVAVALPAGSAFALTLHSSLRLGAAIVPLSPRAPAAGLRAQLRDCRPVVVIGENHGGGAETAAKSLAIPFLQIDSGVVSAATSQVEGGITGMTPAQEISVVYTSGTTGAPRGVRQTFGNHLASALGCRASLSSAQGESWLLVLSPHHIGGLAIFMRGLLAAQPVITLPEFSEGQVLETLRQHRPRLLSLVPAQLRRLLSAGGLSELRDARAILLGGGPAPADDVTEWAAAGLPVCPTYGLTETCSQVCTVPPGMARAMSGTAGPAHPYVRVEVRPSGSGLGEIWVGGPVLSPRYVHPSGEGRNQTAMFPTGDSGELTSEGWLRVSGRLDDTILTAGENVDPGEVEMVLAAHPGVEDIGVVGLADPIYGSRVAAVVVGDVSAEQLQAWAREQLPSFKVPRAWARAAELPRTESGKLQRSRLVEFF